MSPEKATKVTRGLENLSYKQAEEDGLDQPGEGSGEISLQHYSTHGRLTLYRG